MDFGRGIDGVQLDLFDFRAFLRRRGFCKFGCAVQDSFIGRVNIIEKQFLRLVAGGVDTSHFESDETGDDHEGEGINEVRVYQLTYRLKNISTPSRPKERQY